MSVYAVFPSNISNGSYHFSLLDFDDSYKSALDVVLGLKGWTPTVRQAQVSDGFARFQKSAVKLRNLPASVPSCLLFSYGGCQLISCIPLDPFMSTLHLHLHIPTDIHLHLHIHIHLHTHTYTCIYVYIYIYIYLCCICIDIYIYKVQSTIYNLLQNVYTYANAHMYICIYVYAYVYVYVYVYVCVHVYVYVYEYEYDSA